MPTCHYHPGRETLVSCGRCGKPLCPDCVGHGATGVRCRECLYLPRHARGLATGAQLVRALVLALSVSLVLGLGLGMLPWVDFISGLLLGLLAATAASFGARRHRDGAVQAIAVGAALVGVALAVVVMGLRLTGGNSQAFSVFLTHSAASFARPVVGAVLGVVLRFRF